MLSPVQILMILASLVWAFFQLHLFLYSPRKNSTVRMARRRAEFVSKSVAENVTHKRRWRIQMLYSVVKKVPGLGLTVYTTEQYNRYIVTTDYRVGKDLAMPEELYLKQVLYTTLVLLIAGILSLMWAPLFMLSLIGLWVWKLPLRQLKALHEEYNREIIMQFSPFYDLYYSQFATRGTVRKIIDVCQEFLPIANPSMARLLNRFMLDLERDEYYALTELVSRYSDNRYVHRFCQVARVRLQGDEAAFSSLSAFREELQSERKMSQTRQLERRVAVANYASLLMVFSVFAVLTITFLISLLASS